MTSVHYINIKAISNTSSRLLVYYTDLVCYLLVFA
jgi:hypothetical protein